LVVTRTREVNLAGAVDRTNTRTLNALARLVGVVIGEKPKSLGKFEAHERA
jgi:hypothetical protein